jgi:hypothetical protein
VKYQGGWGGLDKVFFKFKIFSDNMEEPDIKNAIKASDLTPVKENFQKIIKRGRRIIETQENEINQEDKNAKDQMQSISYYYTLTFCQIVIFIAFGVYQIYSFRNFVLKIKEY